MEDPKCPLPTGWASLTPAAPIRQQRWLPGEVPTGDRKARVRLFPAVHPTRSRERPERSYMDLPGLPRFRSEQNPDGMALADSMTVLSNERFGDAVRQAAAALSARGISRGDVVAIMLPNRVSFVVAMFATWRIGAIVTPVNPWLTPEEVAHQLKDSSAAILVTGVRPRDKLPPFVQVLTDLSCSVNEHLPEPVSVYDADAAMLIYSSCAKFQAKGIILEHGNIGAMIAMINTRFEIDERSHCLLGLPLFHVHSIVFSVLSPLLAGGCTTMLEGFDPDVFLGRIEEVRPDYFSAAPSVYGEFANLTAETTSDLSSLRFAVCAVAPASGKWLNRFEERFGVPIIEAYGLSEAAGVTAANPVRGKGKPRTAGFPLGGQSVRLDCTDRAESCPGREGEIMIHGRNIMRGYLNRPEETARVFDRGWLRTGDIGRFDEDGYLVLVGRLEDMVVSGGENIHPREIEDVVCELAGVFESAAVGRPHSALGEEVILFVSVVSGSRLSPDDIDDHLSVHLPRHKTPAEVVVVDRIPKSPVGKIDKDALRERVRLQSYEGAI